MSDLTQADIDEAVADYRQRIADLGRHRDMPLCQDVSMAGRQRTNDGDIATIATALVTDRPLVEARGEPEAEVRPDGSIDLRWTQDGRDVSPHLRLHDSVVRVLAAAILATSDPS